MRALSRLIATVLLEHPSLVGLWHVAAEPIDKYTLLLRMREALGIECDVTPRDEPVINRALDPTRFEKRPDTVRRRGTRCWRSTQHDND
jgi:dTDP-4-dehydrorhamnose reductase